MLQQIAALQPLLVGAVLLWSGAMKLWSRYAPAEARRTALTAIVGEDRVVLAYRALGVVELVVAAALIAVPVPLPGAVAGTALTAGFVGYLVYARVAAPESSCGCMGAQPAPITWRSFGRAGVLLVAAGAALLFAGDTWYAAAADGPVLAAVVVVVEAAAVAALSSEFDHRWLIPLRRLHNRLTHPLASGTFTVPVESTVAQLIRSAVWRHSSLMVISDLTEHWDEDEWRFMVYSARHGERAATAVYAVPRLRYDPSAVRVAIVDEESGETLFALDGPPQEEKDLPDWALTSAHPEHVRMAT